MSRWQALTNNWWFWSVRVGCRGVLGVIFLWAFMGKVANQEGLAISVGSYDILPPVLVNPLAVWLIGLEFVVGGSILLGLFSRGSAMVISGLTLVFIVAISVALARGLEIECGCWGIGEGHMISIGLILRDIGLLAASVIVWATRHDPFSLDRLLARRGVAR